MSKRALKTLIASLAVVMATLLLPAAAPADYPGNHGAILILPDPQTSLTRGFALGGSVYDSKSFLPAILNIGNIAQADAIWFSFDLPITLLQKDDFSVGKVDVVAKGTWVEPKIFAVIPVINSRTLQGRGVLLAQLDFITDTTEIKYDGKDGNGAKVSRKIKITQTAAVLRAGFAYGILKPWALGGGVRILAYHKPSLEDKPKGADKTTISGDPGAGLIEFELGTLIIPVDNFNIGLHFYSGASDNPKVTFKTGDNKEKEKIYRVFPSAIGLGLAYTIKQAKNLQLVGDYEQRQNTERDKTDLVLRRQSFSIGANYPITGIWMIRGGLNSSNESGDEALKLLGITGGASVEAMKQLDIDMNLGYFTGSQKIDINDADNAKYTDVRIGAQVNYRFK